MTRGEVAIVAGVILAAIGVGLWVHPGAGLVAAAIGLGLYGYVEIRFPDKPEPVETGEEPTPLRADPGRREVNG